MNQLCKVCGEPAAGFHFGAFTCEGCKSFFGRTYNNIAAIAGCKNSGDCVINKKNRTACKACRLRKCLLVGMSKSGSRYGRRSNWFKIHCLLQEQQQQQQQHQQHRNPQTQHSISAEDGGVGDGADDEVNPSDSGRMSNNLEQLARLHHMHVRQTYQDKTNPCIKTAAAAAAAVAAAAAAAVAAVTTSTTSTSTSPTLATTSVATTTPVHNFLTAAKFLNGISHTPPPSIASKLEPRLSDTPSDSGASSATVEDANEECTLHNCNSSGSGHGSIHHHHYDGYEAGASFLPADMQHERKREKFLQIFRSHSEPLRSPFAPYVSPTMTPLQPPTISSTTATASAAATLLKREFKRLQEKGVNSIGDGQDEPIDLSLKSVGMSWSPSKTTSSLSGRDAQCVLATVPLHCEQNVVSLIMQQKPTPLDLTLVRMAGSGVTVTETTTEIATAATATVTVATTRTTTLSG